MRWIPAGYCSAFDLMPEVACWDSAVDSYRHTILKNDSVQWLESSLRLHVTITLVIPQSPWSKHHAVDVTVCGSWLVRALESE